MSDANTHWDRLKKLLELEEAEEIQAFKEAFQNRTPEERELAGLSLLRMKPSEFHFSSSGHRLIGFVYAASKPLPIYSPEPGDLISVSPSGQIPDRPLLGTVYDKDRQTITVAFREDLEEEAVAGDAFYDLHLSASRGTYKKMDEALRAVRAAKENRLAFFRDLSLGLRKPESYDPARPESLDFINPNLNPWQKEAVAKALAARDLFLLHGPPGTGKTTVLVEIIRQAIGRGQFVFATAPSNTACDQVVECLARAGVAVVRLGHPARIMEHLREHTLDFKLANHPLGEVIRERERRLEQVFRRKERRRDRRNLDFEQRAALNSEIRELKAEIRKLGEEIWNQVVIQAPVMVGTHASGDDLILRKRKPDLVIMDEASQAIEPMAWIPLLGAAKVILAGDPFQLPPTVKCKEAEKQGLGRTLFERLHEKTGEAWKGLLRVQYRMHEKIMDFSSRYFYERQLIADESVRSRTLADLPGVVRSPETEEVFCYLDTAGSGYEEKLEPGSESRFNREEAALVVRKVRRLIDHGVDPKGIAVISPYSAQVRLLSSQLDIEGLEIDTVDGFQGREKEVIFLTLVRSNCEGDLGFLADTRRMNVAMTRAKRKLFVIGDSATLGAIPFYKAFLDYSETIGAYRSVWDDPDRP